MHAAVDAAGSFAAEWTLVSHAALPVLLARWLLEVVSDLMLMTTHDEFAEGMA